MIKLDINVGDIIRVGRFKNKRIKVKDIGTDDYGLPTINGRGILKIRIEKLLTDRTNMKLTKSQFHQIIGCLVEEGRNDLARTLVHAALPNDEIQAAGYYLGFGNLGIEETSDTKKVHELSKKQDWKGIIRYITGRLQSLMESDQMLNDALEEIQEWIRKLKKDKTVISMWETFKQTGRV